MSEVKKIYSLMKECDENIELSKNKNVTLIVGTVNSGKNVLKDFISGNDQNLVAEKHNETFIIRGSDDCNYFDLPKYIFDSSTNLVYYDFPPFTNKRNITTEIASRYYMHKIIDHIKSLKIVFVVNYSLMENTDAEDGFIQLLVHGSKWLRNVLKYKHSIAMIVTNVPFEINDSNDISLINEKETKIKKSVAKFLQHCKADLSNLIPSDSDLLENAEALIEIFSTENGAGYPLIGLFPIPNALGPINKIDLMRATKGIISKLLYSKLEFISKSENDFGYDVSAKHQKLVRGLVDNLKNPIESCVETIVQSIKNFYENMIENTRNIYSIKLNLNNAVQMFSENLKPIKHPKDLLAIIVNILDNLKILTSINNLKNLEEALNHFNFFEALSEIQTSYSNLISWSESFHTLSDYTIQLSDCYSFFNDLFHRLSLLDIQNDTSKYNVANIVDHWGVGGKVGIHITKKNIRVFLDKLSEMGVEIPNNLTKHLENDARRLKVINDILKFTLKDEVHSECISGELFILGNYVKLSEIIKADCKNVTKVDIFALNTIFFDKNVEFTGKKVQLVIISPTWIIIENIEINLDGLPAKDIEENSQQKSAKNGKHGKPGLPGGTSGSILGIGDVFENEKALLLSVNGGNGGRGQNGSVGAKGDVGVAFPAANDKVPPYPMRMLWLAPHNESFKNYLFESVDYDIASYSFRNRIHDNFLTTTMTLFLNEVNIEWLFYFYKVYGIKKENHGSDGGDGGDGGKGGIKGNSGEVIVIGLTQNNSVFILNDQAKDGMNGSGARGGDAGLYGRVEKVVYIIFTPRVQAFEVDHIHYEFSYGHEPSHILYQPGKPGLDGKNTEGMIQPELAGLYNPSYSVNKYKMILLQSFKENGQQQQLVNFFNNLNENVEVQKIYDTMGFIDELHSLDLKFNELKYDINFLPLYESLLFRIEEYSKNPKAYENEDHTKSLVFVYTATLGKISSLKNNWNNRLIVNISNYLKAAIESMSKLNEANTLNALTQYNKNYNNNLIEKIQEAKELTSELTVEINENIVQINEKIHELLLQISEAYDETEKNMEEISQKQKNLQDLMHLKMVSGVLNIIGEALGVPLGLHKIFKKPKSGTRNTKKNFKSGQRKADLLNVFNGMEKLVKQIKEQKLRALDEILEKIGGENELSDTVTFINELKADIFKSINELDLKIVKEVNEKLKNHLDQKEKKYSNNLTRIVPAILAVIFAAKFIMNVASAGIDLYVAYKEDQEKLKELEEAYNKEKLELERLENLVYSIYDVLLPLLGKIYDDLENLEENLPEQSQVALDVSKWKMQTSLRDVKVIVLDLSENFAVQRSFSRTIEKLDETMTTLINIYDRIQSHQDQMAFSNYISEINSAGFNKFPILNETLKEAVNKLNIEIKTNIVLNEYENTIKGFKQFAFPFVEKFISQLRLPNTQNLTYSIDYLTFLAQQQLEGLYHMLVLDDATVGVDDKYTNEGEFGTYKNTDPFYVWKNEEFGDSIEKLLSGEEIVIKADVTKGLNNKYAIKFKVVGIKFVSENKTIERDIDGKLQRLSLEITHLGNSYYRCEEKIYIITSETQEISYSFKHKKDSWPLNSNHIYKKLRNGNLMLSPYAMWKIKLVTDDTWSADLKILAKYSKYVDLQLIGSGQYVSSKFICSSDLNQHYKLDESIENFDPYHFFPKITENIRTTRSTNHYENIGKNSGGTVSSHINRFFNWILNLVWVDVNENHQFQDSSYFKPAAFYDHFFSFIMLIPIFFHFWKIFFRNKTTEKHNISTIRISAKRMKIWEDFLKKALIVKKILEKNLEFPHLEIQEYNKVIETRKNEILSLSKLDIVSKEKIEDFEKNLIAFTVDIIDDLQFNKNFVGIKDKNIVKALKNLIQITKKIPNFKKKLEKVNVNYCENFGDFGQNIGNLMERNLGNEALENTLNETYKKPICDFNFKLL